MLLGVVLFIVVIFIVLILFGLYLVKMYNNLITLGERVNNGKAQIATQIESRYDAVKNLIDATKQYSKHESETLEKVVSQRVNINQNSSMKFIEEQNDQLNNVVGRLIAISESYPELKASSVYQTTMENVDKYENNVRHSRMIYNDTVTRFNRALLVFPTNILAKFFGFVSKEYFESTETKQEMPSWD